MSESDSVTLSPRRRTELVPTGLPFGLSWEDLRACLGALDGARLDEARAFLAYDKAGRFQGSGNSVILTVDYPTAIDRRQAHLFIKETGDQGKEVSCYRLLTQLGLPTPRLLAVIERGRRPVIVTELLSRIGIDTASEDEVGQLLDLLAKLNAASGPAANIDAGPGRPESEMDALRRAGIERLALDSRTGADPDRWLAAFEQTQPLVAAMPRALTHGEFSFQQCGWSSRDGRATLVLFDLATVGLRPRFADLASILKPSAQALNTSEERVLGWYLDRLAGQGVAAPGVDEAMKELRVFRTWVTFCAMHWLTHDVYEPGSDELLDVAEQLTADMSAAGLL